jgi:hypothetical protein
MRSSAEFAPALDAVDSHTTNDRLAIRTYFSQLTSVSDSPWDHTTLGALLSLVVIWAAWLYGTWAYWGNLTADCGREMYVAQVLAEGGTLYRDVWFNFGPASPYFNSFLFRLFGIHLNVLYWAGALTALGSAIFLFLIGMRLSSRLAGWTAGTVLLCEAFHPSLFSFPLPYSFAAAYGCLVFIVFLWLVVHASNSPSRAWIFAAAWATAIAILLKPEFGSTCAITLSLLIGARAFQRRSWRFLWRDILVTLPAALSCSLVVAWMISLRGVTFLVQENFQSWPTSYFMRRYGKVWFAFTGFSLSPSVLAGAALHILVFLAFVQGVQLISSWKRPALGRAVLRVVLFLGSLIYFATFVPWQEALRWAFFPQDMVVMVGIAAAFAWVWYLWQPESEREPAIPLILTSSTLVSTRIMFRMLPWTYPIFFNGAVVLCFLLLLRPLFAKNDSESRFKFRGHLLLYAACIAVTLLNSRRADTPSDTVVPLVTERGTIKVTPTRAEQYRAAIEFMKQKSALGEYVLSVPEDQSLYFLSGTNCPTRVTAFTPGMVAPGKMTDELIHEVESKKVRYLIWSNRIFWEYGVPRFGIDFDQTFGNYLFSHYHRVGPLTPNPVKLGQWNAYIWERIPQSSP